MLIDPGLPLPNYRFIVSITSAGIPNLIDMQFQEVSGLKMTRSITENGSMTSLSNQQTKQTLTLKRGVFTAPSPLMLGNVAESLFWDTRLLRKDILVSILDESDTPVNAWLVTNAYLESWTWDSLNADSGKLLMESMEFKYSGLKYIPIKLTKTG